MASPDDSWPPMDPDVSAWLHSFVQAVRTNDIDLGESLFLEDCVGYGTLQGCAVHLEDLREQQWRPTWSRVKSWTITSVDMAATQGGLALVAFTWKRKTHDAADVEGRASLVLKETETGWKCIHSHFSADPRLHLDGSW